MNGSDSEKENPERFTGITGGYDSEAPVSPPAGDSLFPRNRLHKPHPSHAGRVVGFLDIGTNSVRLLVVRINQNGSYTVLTRQKGTVRLGEGAFMTGFLAESAMDRCVTVCLRLVELARSFWVEEIIAVATAATREAGNCRDLLERLRHEVAIDVRVISGREEARLIYLGVAAGIELPRGESALFIDIGGGSTEVVIGTRTQYLFLESLKLGAIRLTNLFFPDGCQEPVSPDRIDQIRTYIRDTAIRVIQASAGDPISTVIGSSGTIENLAEMVMRSGQERVVSGMVTVNTQDLERLVRELYRIPLNKRRSFPGMNPDRADIIIGGGLIITTLLQDLGLPSLTVSSRGLQDGLLVDYLSKIDDFPLLSDLSLREKSVLQLGRSFHINEYHARTVTEVALDLFDSARDTGLHTLDSWDREMLEYAAFLHDIGSAISYVNHHLHSAYIIKNVEILGFNQQEQSFIAHIARFHRKKIPHKKVDPDTDLPPDLHDRATLLSTFLRLAESLDRSHTALILQARFVASDDPGAHLLITSRGECHLEIWGIENEKKAFSKIFKKELSFRVVTAPHDRD